MTFARIRKDYLAVSVVALIFAFSSAYTLFKINRASTTLSEQYPLAVWMIDQLESEYIALEHTLQLYSVGEVDKEALLVSYDILWNRTEVVLQGAEAGFARAALGAGDLASRLLNTLKRLDEQVQALPQRGNKAVSSEIISALAVYREPLHEMNIRSFHERDSVYGLDALGENLNAAGIAFLGLMISGMLLIIMLVREFSVSRHRANHDELSGLSNRRHFMEQLDRLIDKAERNHESFAVYLIDLDDFKLINDNHGHLFGDKVLQVVSQRLRHNLRRLDIAARLGGDEFAVIQYPVENRVAVQALLDRLRIGLSGTISSGLNEAEVEFSLGVAVYPEDGHSATELLYKADMKMYLEKDYPSKTAAPEEMIPA